LAGGTRVLRDLGTNTAGDGVGRKSWYETVDTEYGDIPTVMNPRNDEVTYP
jgi:hypothetical protein